MPIRRGKGESARPPGGTYAGNAVRDVIGNRNFRLLCVGEGISLVGDQFYYIALPWLVPPHACAYQVLR